MGRYDDRPYEVSKGKPPNKHQFQKGQSGNPGGSSKRVKAKRLSLRGAFREILDQKAMITMENGAKSVVIKREALLFGIVHDTGGGHPVDRFRAFRLLLQLGVLDNTAEEEKATRDIDNTTLTEVVEKLAAELGYNTKAEQFDDPQNRANHEAYVASLGH